jgi:hypothetical protein
MYALQDEVLVVLVMVGVDGDDRALIQLGRGN